MTNDINYYEMIMKNNINNEANEIIVMIMKY